jgi:hypothetical protein
MLEKLTNWLMEAGYDAILQKKSPQLPMDFIQMNLITEDESVYPSIVTLYNTEPGRELFAVPENAVLVHVVYQMPQEVTTENYQNTTRLINLINRSCPFPCFGYDEVDKKIYYRTVFPLGYTEEAKEEFLAAIDMIVEVLGVYGTGLELVSTGKATLEELFQTATS